VEERNPQAEQRMYAARLAGGLIHEIRNPLNSLSLNLQLLAEDWREPRDQRERRALKRIERLQAEAARLSGILDDFMDFLRERKLMRTPCDINRLVEDLVNFVRPQIEARGIQLRASYGNLPQCHVDVNLLKQGLLNLILNAEEAVANAPTREVILRTAHDGDNVRVDVIDTGPGIRPEDKEKIFEVFYSTRKGGSGLGLPTARRIVEEHGGSIEVHSDVGRGTCFTVRLPIGRPDPRPAAQHGDAERGGGIT